MTKKAFIMVGYPLAEAIKEIQDKIDENDLYVETDPSKGFFYGKGKEYEQKLAGQLPETITLEPIHFMFRKEDYREIFTE